jgi:hypothetical protein
LGKKHDTIKYILIKNILLKFTSFIIGLLGGIISFMLVVLIESALASFYPNFLFKNNPYYLLILVIPSLVEEATKISIARRLMDNFKPFQILLGVGLGFGAMEAIVALSQISWLVFSHLLTWIHLIFLGTGYLIARFYDNSKHTNFFIWLTASFFLHWLYDILVYVFTK